MSEAGDFRLVWPAPEYLASYVDALRRGWSPDNSRPEAAAEELLEIEADAESFLRGQVDRDGEGPPITLPDGSLVPRLPGYHRWMWDSEFRGELDFRRQPGTTNLPPSCLGHSGYSVVPWKRRLGYATRAVTRRGCASASIDERDAADVESPIVSGWG